jgi:hypothetical protein
MVGENAAAVQELWFGLLAALGRLNHGHHWIELFDGNDWGHQCARKGWAEGALHHKQSPPWQKRAGNKILFFYMGSLCELR